MIGQFRKFSGTIYAKILLGIIIIPFVFWGMSSSILGGSKNVVVVIDKEKYSIEDFSNFMQNTATKKVESKDIDEFLYSFIAEKLMEKEIEYFEIKLSDSSLAKLIKHQVQFKRENKFSRTEYEKFLLKNNITATAFESIILKEEKKKQLLNFVSGGVYPSNFLVNASYDKINQQRSIQLINLNDAFQKQLNFSEDQIKTFFNDNKNKYNKIYKTINIIELNPKKLINNNDFNDLFFKKIDEIDDLIFSGKKLNYIIQKFNLEKPNSFTINDLGEDINSKTQKEITKSLLTKIFSLEEVEPTALIETKDKYFIVELIKTESVQKNFQDVSIKKEILLDMVKNVKRKLITELIAKINKNNFVKDDFDKFSKEKNVNIKEINLNSQKDNEKIDQQVVNQVYAYPKNSVIVVSDIGLAENFLIYIDEIKNASINASSAEYPEYFDLAKRKIVNELYNSYDSYIKKKYKIDINYQALDTVKSYYN
ncbi:MAG: hypothetical protein EVA76_03555 [Candidatus Pelagibacterales bacterium]|nr:MAG: hypothetical protein EVA76_03555 [Pelagibacterales bacterium]